MSYNASTNTLTLNNVNTPDIGLVFDGMGKESFDSDIKVVLVGKNSIRSIYSGHGGFSVEGSGSLTINESKKAQGSAVSVSGMSSSEDSERAVMHIGKDATVTIYKATSEQEDATPSCISFDYIDKEKDKISDYLIYDGQVTPELKVETVETWPAYIGTVSLNDSLCVKTDYSTDRLYNDKENSNFIRLLVEGKVEDSNETYSWVEKHNGYWFVSRNAFYDTGINGSYSGSLPSDLKTGDNKITAYVTANSTKASNLDRYENYVVYTKGGKYYAIAPKCMLVDELVETDVDSTVYCIGEIKHSEPVFYFDFENETNAEYKVNPYDTWLMDTYSEVSGVSTWEEAAKYMTDNGYTKYTKQLSPASYAFEVVNDKITFSPKEESKSESKQTSSSTNTTTTNNNSTSKTPKTGETTKDSSGAVYTVTSSSSKAVEVAYKASSKASKKVTIPATVKINGVRATVTSISDGAFSGNKKITEVVLPKKVKKIGKKAFRNCPKLKKITLSKNLKSIGTQAFSGDTGLKKIIVKSTGIKSVGKKAFKKVPKSATIQVPKKMKKKYTKLFKKAGFKGKVK